MAGIGRRLGRLEDRSRGLALARIKDLFDDLTDREVVLELARVLGGALTADQDREGMRAEAKLKASGIDGLLELAVRPKECATDQEVGHRIRDVVAEAIFADGRRERLLIVKRGLEKGAGMRF